MFFVYLTASGKNGTLYAGHCEDLGVRIQQHKEKGSGGFTARYGVDQLVWFEIHPPTTKRFGGSGRSRNGNGSGSCN